MNWGHLSAVKPGVEQRRVAGCQGDGCRSGMEREAEQKGSLIPRAGGFWAWGLPWQAALWGSVLWGMALSMGFFIKERKITSSLLPRSYFSPLGNDTNSFFPHFNC